ncbi:E3 ubiquitin-protein ligase RING1-like [Acorus calamus]|uniref:RING-type E3 ubiquitin transferase n=1 Tax=Acorus calamus TaxID=4465 RepID=A0AAV9C589_ACOCL|nr:E3 ubiquitin-protein ligase RING1-like [Acorus calamus]KAK1307890.1 E3 ubiquitin-protein ligase RING1-like [Acorus calamus]
MDQQMESGVQGFSIVFPVLLNLSATVSPGEPHRGLLVINLEGGGPDVGGDGAAQMMSLEDLLTRLAEAASMAETGRKGPPPASKASIAAMEEVEAAAVAEGEECPVCLEGLAEEEAEPARAMPCKHRFHGECIRKWLEMHGSCPVCRFQMPAEEEKEGTKKAAEEAVSEGDRGADES